MVYVQVNKIINIYKSKSIKIITPILDLQYIVCRTISIQIYNQNFPILQFHKLKMTKKRSRPEDQQQFQPSKSKSSIPQVSKPRTLDRSDKKKQQKKKQHQKLMIYNHLRVEDRKAHEQKYKQNLLLKKIEQEKRGFLKLKYDLDNDDDSQYAEIDKQSMSRREQNQIIRQIKDMLQAQQAMSNKNHLSLSAENQFAKVQKLTESINEKQHQLQNKQPSEKQHASRAIDECHFGMLPKQNKNPQILTPNPKTIIERIADLEMIYY